MFVGPQAQTNRVEKVYETLPVNAASELRKRPPSLCVSSKVNVLQKAKVRGVSVCLCVRWPDCFSSLSSSGVGVSEGVLDEHKR